MQTFQQTLNGHIMPADKARSDYLYVPFDLPAPAARLHVRYRYSDPIGADQYEGGNVIDLGLFDPRGYEFPGGAGFRGWSGSNRHAFTITPSSATPGYLPGPLPAGRYHVILGLYRIWERGADYTIEVEADLDDEQPAADGPDVSAVHAPAQAAAGAGRGASDLLWLRGDLQSHTEHSDARGTLAQLVARARALGLDFLAITDHNTISHHAHLPALAGDDLLLIAGQECTTYYGHMNIWGTRRWCDFRCRTDTELAAVIDLAHASGGLCSINHPKAFGPPWEHSTALPVDAIEVWQGPWPWRNTESLALWERLLLDGRRLPSVGGSDYHCPAGEETGFLRLGQPTTWVKARERSVAAVLEAIRAGRVSISASPEGPRLDLRATAGAASADMGEELALAPGATAEVEVEVVRGAGWTLRLIADGAIVHETPITTDATTVRVALAARRYLRAELVGDARRDMLPPNAPTDLDLRAWRWALSNPIYIRE